MIGVVVVTHGGLASELVAAAAQIVGELPRSAAVSIGWSDDPVAAREAVERAIADVGAEGALVLTDMFGGTPTNLALPSLGPSVEIVTGVNLPMLIKLSSVRDGELKDVARVIREYGQAAIHVASELLEPRKP
ncbi:MAG: PTS fructose transporter subunit IIA [Vicinamibacteria bacterium]|nr:PTS fructose transporter subunit IIA [Vicinamibacteria bacterium]